MTKNGSPAHRAYQERVGGAYERVADRLEEALDESRADLYEVPYISHQIILEQAETLIRSLRGRARITRGEGL